MSLIIPANSASAAGGYAVDNSLRFNSGSSDNLSKSLSTPTNDKKFTFSCWFKKSKNATEMNLFGYQPSGNAEAYIGFSDSDQIRYADRDSGDTTPEIFLVSNAKLRDVSAWYHVVVSVDTTQGTDSNRAKLYLNGEQITSLANSTYPSQNYTPEMNSSDGTKVIGADNNGNYFNGYMAEVILVDGQALDPTSFGEFDEDSGIWKPIDVSGLTFGTNGFYLDFENSGALGADVSGNTNNFTVNNLTAIDQSTDTCTNNFATMNPLDNFYAGSTFSEGNLNLVMANTPTTWNTSTIGVSSGKWYFEVKELAEGASGSSQVGVADRPTVSASEELGGLATTFAYTSNGRFRTNNSQTAADKPTWGVNDIIGIALDMDASPATVTFTKNGSAAGSTQNLTATGTGFYFLAIGAWVDGSVTFSANFGSPAYSESGGNSDGNGYGNFKTAPPSGHYALNTKNLAEYG